MLSVLGIIVIVAIVVVALYYLNSQDGGFSFSAAASSPSSSATSTSSAASSSAKPSSSSAAVLSGSSSSGSSKSTPSSGSSSASTNASSPSPTSSLSSSSGGSGSGMFGVTDDTCGESGAVEEPVAGGGPNGSQDWLNCGLSKDSPDSKWTPPHIEISQLKSVALDEALKLDIFSACGDFEEGFQAASDSTGIPAVMLVSIAMTESSCNPDAKGDNGDAWGLMQILSDKCGGAPGGDCADPTFNIQAGADYFKSQLDSFEGSTLLALGQYNGWTSDLTYNIATAAGKDQSTCVYQNNLDYFEVILNGYMQGVDGQSLATIKNLAICDDDR
ncbi:hypothetical protein JCM10207_000998 [Rhodosporidiobolus poonsookiae]